MARLHTSTRPATARAGFTLIELLIAVLIIAILATLVTLGVSKAMSYAKQVATKTEMGQIEQALGVAAIEMGRVPYIPSYLVLKPSPSDYDNSNPYENMSRRVLIQMFPKWVRATWPIDTLKADQAYVFFLRGRGGNGFSTGADPWDIGAGKRYGPYYEFKSDRLEPPAANYPAYRDYWDNPGKHLVVFSQMMVGQSAPPAQELPPGYPARQLQATNKYYMPKGYQIFSAGKDGLWGSYPSNQPFTGGPSIFPPGNPGEDDQSNFADEPHGKPIND